TKQGLPPSPITNTATPGNAFLQSQLSGLLDCPSDCASLKCLRTKAPLVAERKTRDVRFEDGSRYISMLLHSGLRRWQHIHQGPLQRGLGGIESGRKGLGKQAD